jgi:flagellar biosynthesis component FlhA
MLKNLASKLNKQVKKVNFKGTLQDKRVLYAVGLLSLLYVLFLANEKDFNSVFVFTIVGFLLSFFTKNMILILIVALLFTHFIKFTIHYEKETMENKKKKEGMENKKKKEGMEDKDESKEEEEKEEEPKLDKVEVDADLPENEDMSEGEKKQKKEEYDKLKKEFVEFQSIQKDILKNMQEIDPLLNKAENFINKFEHYKKNK